MNGKPYTSEEDREILACPVMDKNSRRTGRPSPLAQLADELGRSYESIQRRRRALMMDRKKAAAEAERNKAAYRERYARLREEATDAEYRALADAMKILWQTLKGWISDEAPARVPDEKLTREEVLGMAGKAARKAHEAARWAYDDSRDQEAARLAAREAMRTAIIDTFEERFPVSKPCLVLQFPGGPEEKT